ncbi:MAG TPA: alpha/beta hydrolase [Acidimicrobiales bacterium]|nr:alpha/beta hydrolase [Acidimicrobiales bacterium]
MGYKRLPLVMLACVLISGAGLPAAAAGGPPANSGLHGSSCAAAADTGSKFTAPDSGVTTTGLGSDAPAYYEIGAPSGAYAGRAPRAIMIVIHPGGWFFVGKEVVARWARPMANRWRDAGWQTINIDYRACGQSIVDVLWFMQRVRVLHPEAVICAVGSSAGGHLAMLLATMRQDLACAISRAGPTDLLSLDRQSTFDSGSFTRAGPQLLSNYAIAAFGAKPSPLVYRSPRQQAKNITARVLLATGQTDPLVPRAQDTEFAKTLRAARPSGYVDVVSLPAGDRFFVHTYVSRASLSELRLREDALVAPLLAPAQTQTRR